MKTLATTILKLKLKTHQGIVELHQFSRGNWITMLHACRYWVGTVPRTDIESDNFLKTKGMGMLLNMFLVLVSSYFFNFGPCKKFCLFLIPVSLCSLNFGPCKHEGNYKWKNWNVKGTKIEKAQTYKDLKLEKMNLQGPKMKNR